MSIEWGQARTDSQSPHGSLSDDYLIPPFSVLDTRQGYWQERRRRWLSLGLQSEIGRGEGSGHQRGKAAAYEIGTMQDGTVIGASGALRSGAGRELQSGRGNYRADFTVHEPGQGNIYVGGYDPSTSPGVSIFDPVLCELTYRWWCPPGGAILDPFAGGSVRGIVAARMGHPYVGIDLSSRQVEANHEQAKAILREGDPVPRWVVGDSLQLTDHLRDGERFDLVFTCPPYYDLEVYSDDPRDLSAMPNYASFLDVYRRILEAAVTRLRAGRFAAVVVSEVRDKRGFYLGLVPDTMAALRDAGAHYYNEAILVNSVGSLPLRVGQYMASSRKLGRTHQNLIVAVKGDPTTARGWDYERDSAPDPQIALWGDDGVAA